MGEESEGKGGLVGMAGDVPWGGEHKTQCTDDALQTCTPGTCVVSETSVTPINSVKKKKRAR